MRKERTRLTSDDHLTGLYALDEVVDKYTNVPARDIGHSRAYVAEEALRRYPLTQTDKTLVDEPSARYKERPDLTSSDYGVAIKVFDRAAKRQDPAERKLVRAALKSRKDELVGIEDEQTHLAHERALETASREDNGLENLVRVRKVLSAVGWNGVAWLLAVPFNNWVEGAIAGVTGAAFVARREVKSGIRVKQRKRQNTA